MDSVRSHRAAWETDDVATFRSSVRKLIERDFLPMDKQWRENGRVDPEAWRVAGSMGMLAPDIPEVYGGAAAGFEHDAVVFEELAYAGITSIGNAVQSITAHYILAYGTEDQKERWLPGIASGDYICAIAMTEPGTGSDLGSIQTRADRSEAGYVINGAKTFISNGQIANLICVVTKTEVESDSKGVSLIMVETEQVSGFRRGKALDKVGQHGQDTSELFFDNCVVPTANLIGLEENQGFYQLMQQLPFERLIVAIMGIAAAERAIDLTVQYTAERHAFGKALAEFQNTRFLLAQCRTEASVGRVFVDHCISQHVNGKLDSVTASMAKYWVTEKQCEIIDHCVQLFGGYGYMLEYPIANMYLDARGQKIYAGTNEIMKELIARDLWSKG